MNKKFLLVSFITAIASVSLTGCNQGTNTDVPEETAVVSETAGSTVPSESPESVQDEQLTEETVAVSETAGSTAPSRPELKQYEFPEIPAGYGSITVPDFLTDEQKNNFIKAAYIFDAFDMGFSSLFTDIDYQNTYKKQKDGFENADTYTRTGVSYDSFCNALGSVFTKDFADSLLSKIDIDVVDGEIGFVDAAKGRNADLENVVFEKTDDTHFNAVAAYGGVDGTVTVSYALSDDGKLFSQFNSYW